MWCALTTLDSCSCHLTWPRSQGYKLERHIRAAHRNSAERDIADLQGSGHHSLVHPVFLPLHNTTNGFCSLKRLSECGTLRQSTNIGGDQYWLADIPKEEQVLRCTSKGTISQQAVLLRQKITRTSDVDVIRYGVHKLNIHSHYT